jgi:hypothetical protein
MTRRGTGNRQKKVVTPRGSRGGERPPRPTPTRPAPSPKTPGVGDRRGEKGPEPNRE